jgi:diaminohydroxyphosphoribosylaminopyrimidine deaminase/5-amino-6-(5-phosphoribosylamino)uracil reductase
MSRADEKWIHRAIDLAERGRYTVSPNPMVGAVVVRGGKAVGEGFHQRAGGPHAEVRALERAGAAARGADLYVSLEPCAHFGRTPPCFPAILASGIRRVVFAARDPNPAVAGRGIAELERGGVEVVEAGEPLRRRAERQNERFRVWIIRRRPFVLAKWAQTLDGKLAPAAGAGRWITGEKARRRALLLREEYDAVLVGARTVIADDPLLTRRLGKNRATPHLRIVLDGSLAVSDRARVFRRPGDTLVVTARSESHAAARRLRRRGVRVWSLPGADGRVRIPRLLRELHREGVASLLVEGGGETLWEFFRAGSVDRAMVFIAPRILGGTSAPGSVAGRGFSLSAAPRLQEIEIEAVGEDFAITGRL